MRFFILMILDSILHLNNYVLAEAAQIREIKLGILKHSVKSGLKHTYERGYDLNIEYLISSPKNKFFKAISSPYLHIGSNISSGNATSIIYSGMTCRGIFKERYFLEASFGGCIHNGKLKQSSASKKALGSRLLFRESISIGMKFENKQNVSLFLDHASNAKLASPNPGLTDFGIRYGLEF